MRSDVGELGDFYRSAPGRAARRAVGGHLRALWGDVAGLNVLGIGYATPWLDGLRGEAARAIALMPARQGVLRWPEDGPNAAALADEAELPFPDMSMDRVLLVHALESTERLRPMLREVWRVMADGGRLLAVVPNRTGVWARLDRTPFGHGRPFTQAQIARLLRETMFDPGPARSALFAPPSRRRFLIAAAPPLERIGARWFPAFGGVLVVEAGKRLYAATAAPAAAPRAAPAGRPSPA